LAETYGRERLDHLLDLLDELHELS